MIGGREMKILSGKGASSGAVIGRLRFIPRGGEAEAAPVGIVDPETELERLTEAKRTLSCELDSLYESALKKS